jgi:hypothetical protein
MKQARNIGIDGCRRTGTRWDVLTGRGSAPSPVEEPLQRADVRGDILEDVGKTSWGWQEDTLGTHPRR